LHMIKEEFFQKLDHFLDSRIASCCEAIEETQVFPREYLSDLGELKVYGLTVAVENGGLGLTPLDLKELLYRVALFSPTLSLVMSIPIFNNYIIATYGNSDQLRDLLPKLCRGEKFCAFAYTEMGNSGPNQGFLTRARICGNGIEITGEKNMISWGGEADYYLTVATFELDEKTSRPTTFLVPKTRPGVEFGGITEKMAFPGLILRNVYYRNVQLEKNEMLGRPGFGLKIVDEALQLGRLCAATISLALAQSAFDDAVAHVLKPRANGQRLADLQAIQISLAEMKLQLEASRGLVDAAWQQWGDGEQEKTTAISLAKINAARTVMYITDRALQFFGGGGYLKGNVMERRFRQARIFSLVEGTSEILMNIVANRILGGRQ